MRLTVGQCTYDIEIKYHNQSRNHSNVSVRLGVPCTSWTYDQTYFKSTIVSEVCMHLSRQVQYRALRWVWLIGQRLHVLRLFFFQVMFWLTAKQFCSFLVESERLRWKVDRFIGRICKHAGLCGWLLLLWSPLRQVSLSLSSSTSTNRFLVDL